MQPVKPIESLQQQEVIALTRYHIHLAEVHFKRKFNSIPVLFNLSGRIAGMYKVVRGGRVIRYNPYLFAKYYTDNLATTVPHEVAHYVTDMVYGIRRIRPHGKEWQSVMHLFGVEPKVTCDYDLSGIPVRTQRRFDYRCNCRSFTVTTRRHNMIRLGIRRYECPDCKSFIQAV